MSQLEQAQLQAAYRYCRKLNAQHGKTFFLATALLPPPARPHVHALYGFARYADDLVDRPGLQGVPGQDLADLRAQVQAGFTGATERNPVVLAMQATVARYDIEPALIADFLAAMESDLSVTRYPSFAELRAYMWGSASVIGLQLLPILGVTGDLEVARTAASDLGIAFQLTNFIRDIGEDYVRGRIYLPQDAQAAHGVSEAMFGRDVVSAELRELLRAEIARARGFYRSAEAGIHELAPTARDCVRTALTLYSDILTEVQRVDYQVLRRRARVGLPRRAVVGGRGYFRSVRRRRTS